MSANDPGDKARRIAEEMAAMREAAGMPAPEGHELAPKIIWTRAKIDDLAARVAELLKSGENGLYRRANDLGTIENGSGEWEPMTARRFRTWLPRTCGILPIEGWSKEKAASAGEIPTSKPIKGELDLEQCATILTSDDVRVKLPRIEHINKVKLPVFRESIDLRGRDDGRRGFRKIELLPQGYDPASKTFTLEGGIDYDEDRDPSEALKFLTDLLAHFPFADERSRAVQVAAMLTIFCARMFTGRPPLFIWNSNLPGSGKSRLAQLCLSPVHGSAPRAGFSYDDKNEVRKELDAVAQNFGPFVFFDDLRRGVIRNEHLHRFITAPDWSCRILGSHRQFHGALYAATFITGNELTLQEDLERRALWVDLFARTTARDRELPASVTLLDDDFFKDEHKIGDVLASLWALVRYWDDCDRPRASDRPLESFEGWCRIVPAIVESATFANPLAPFAAPDAGNTGAREMEQLMEAVLTTLAGPEESTIVKLQDVTRLARENSLFQWLLWTLEDVIESEGSKDGFKPKANKDIEFGDDDADKADKRTQAAGWLNHSMRSKWGKLFKSKAANGRIWKTKAGAAFEVGSRETKDLSRIVLRRLR